MNPDRAPVFSRKEWTVSEIAAVVTRSLARSTDGTDPLRYALEAVLAHYCRILTDNLNRMPEAHLAAFVSVLRASPAPPLPATVPLSFKATSVTGATAAREGPVVPRYTEVAAAAGGGSAAPVVFQTTRDLQVLRAELVRAMAVDFRRAVVADASAILSDSGAPGAGLFAKAVPLTRAMHVGHRALGDPPCLAALQLSVDMDGVPASPAMVIEWGIVTPNGFTTLAPLRDTTQGLTRSGEIAFGGLAGWPRTSLRGIECCWLTARVRSIPVSAMPDTVQMPPATYQRTIRQLRVSVQHASAATPPDAALYGRTPVDLTRDFFPFGERPRFGDVFYVASKYFALGGSLVELRIALTNPVDADPAATPIPPVSSDGNPRLQWDIHAASGWVPLSVDDQTQACTVSGTLAFTVPADASPSTIGNTTCGWIRARLVCGSYGSAEPVAPGAVPPVSAPSIASMTVTVSITRGPDEPEHVVLDSGLEETEVGRAADSRRAPFCPFPPFDAPGEALYIGVLAARDELAKHMLNLYIGVPPDDAPPVLCESFEDLQPPCWQVRGAAGWRDCVAVDRTGGLRQSGFVKVTVGDDVAVWSNAVADPAGKLLWLRLLPGTRNRGEFVSLNIGRIALNAVPALQAARFERELLGSSTGRPAQVFHAARSPFVGDVELEVREGPTSDSQEWARWSGVEDFEESTPLSSHFVVDRINGTVSFGDGRRGRLPPAGGNNVRVSYASGGGARGNAPVSTVKQLRTTIPYVESVTNVDAASGGQDAQDAPSTQSSALAWLRHRDRAVCLEDYAALALRASPEVARAVALGVDELKRLNLLTLDRPADSPRAAIVGVSIVPRSDAPEPQPPRALLANVKRYLDARRPAGVDLILFGPSYLRVSVLAALAIDEDAQLAHVVAQCEQRLNRFLHPLTGGRDGRGWDFGERPHASDFHRVLVGVDGLDYVQSLRLQFSEAFADAPGAAGLLVCSGRHRLSAG